MVPEVGFNTLKKLKNLNNKNFNEITKNNKKIFLTTSYKVYIDRTFESFELFDSIIHKNITRVYPHKLFCNNQIKDRCIVHDSETAFYVDSNHPSISGSKLINQLILNKIESINNLTNK